MYFIFLWPWFGIIYTVKFYRHGGVFLFMANNYIKEFLLKFTVYVYITLIYKNGGFLYKHLL